MKCPNQKNNVDNFLSYFCNCRWSQLYLLLLLILHSCMISLSILPWYLTLHFTIQMRWKGLQLIHGTHSSCLGALCFCFVELFLIKVSLTRAKLLCPFKSQVQGLIKRCTCYQTHCFEKVPTCFLTTKIIWILTLQYSLVRKLSFCE